LSILLLHPLLDDENEAKWVRVVGKFFYFLLLPLTVLMFISIGVRLGDYGVTPNRYIMLLLAFWLFATCLYFIFSKKRNIIVIPASLMLISFFCSFGPWSVMQVSVRSQTAILKQLFIDNKLMKNDTLCALSKTQDTSVKDTLLKGTGRRIESILVALEEMGEMGTVKKWIPKTWQKAVFRDANNFDITVLQDKLNVDFAANVFEEIDRAPIASGDYHHAECIKHDLQNSIETYNFKRIWAFSQNGSAAGDLISSETEGNTLTFKTNEAEYKVDLTPFLADLMKTGSFEVATHVDVPAKNMIINGNGFKILVSSCAFNSKDETNTLSNISGVFLFNK
jgi:hypothetical protein